MLCRKKNIESPFVLWTPYASKSLFNKTQNINYLALPWFATASIRAFTFSGSAKK